MDPVRMFVFALMRGIKIERRMIGECRHNFLSLKPLSVLIPRLQSPVANRVRLLHYFQFAGTGQPKPPSNVSPPLQIQADRSHTLGGFDSPQTPPLYFHELYTLI